ncbi:MAG: hypothetical protein HKN87_22575 [Saprospiraceae bacterium]|nr:hypothetical protein [Saprospiraceae bacterium]
MTKLTRFELALISDANLLTAKRIALEKIQAILQQTKQLLEEALTTSTLSLPMGENVYAGKISRGENYRGLPYLILDFPAYFEHEDVYAFRTMFWWGHFFSVTLHLQGQYWLQHQQSVFNNFDALLGKHYFIAIGSTPWEYHYNEDNYVLLTGQHRDLLGELPFLKISKQIPLDQSMEVTSSATEFFSNMAEALVTK